MLAQRCIEMRRRFDVDTIFYIGVDYADSAPAGVNVVSNQRNFVNPP